MYMATSWAPFKRSLHTNREGSGLGGVLSEPLEVLAPAASTCRVTSKHHLTVASFGLQGELDAATAGEVRVMLSAAAEEAVVLFDLSDITRVDFEGVALLRDAIRTVHEHGGRVAITRPWRLARALMSLVGAQGLVLFALSSAGALAWLQEHAITQTDIWV
jgi:anti-anti-sigma factor